MSIFKSKMSKISHSYQKFSKFPKSPFSIPKFPKFPFSDLNSHFRTFLSWSENGGFRMKFTDIYWYFDFTDSYWYFDYWYFDFTDNQLHFFKYHWKWYFQPSTPIRNEWVMSWNDSNTGICYIKIINFVLKQSRPQKIFASRRAPYRESP